MRVHKLLQASLLLTLSGNDQKRAVVPDSLEGANFLHEVVDPDLPITIDGLDDSFDELLVINFNLRRSSIMVEVGV